MSGDLRLWPAVRALVMDRDRRVLLVNFDIWFKEHEFEMVDWDDQAELQEA